MKRKYYMLGIFLLGILVLSMSFGFTVAFEDGDDGGDDPPEEPHEPDEPEEPEEPHEPDEPEEPHDDIPDDDHDGVDDNVEEEEKRDIVIWFGDHVIEMSSILRHGDQKDILDMRVGFNEHGLSVRVSFGTIMKVEDPAEEPEEPAIESGDNHEWIEYKLEFEVYFRGFIEFVDLNDNGIYDHEIDKFIEDYGINSFQPISYSLTPISNDSNLHYFLLNTTDGVFAAHIYFVEEFVYLNDNIIAPTQVKIDIEITDFDYINDSSQLALITKLRSETYDYEKREETKDEQDGYGNEEEEVYIENDIYTGIFSWKETAMIDGVEMEVKTSNLDVDVEDENIQILLINYPRGNHIYHDPKIGISITTVFGATQPTIVPIIIIGSVVAVIGVATVASLILRKRKIIR